MLELGRPIHGYDGDRLQGPIRVRRAARGRAADHPRRRRPRRCRPRTSSSSTTPAPIGLAGVMGGATTEMSDDHDHRRDRGGALGRGRRCSAPASATSSPPRRQAQRARRRPDQLPRSPPTASSSCSRRTAAAPRARRHRGRHRRPSRRRSRSAVDLPGRIAGLAIDDDAVAGPAGDRRRRRRRRTTASRSPRRRGGPTSPTPTTWSRRSSGIVGYDRCPSVLPAAPAGPWADPRAAAAPPRSAARWPALGCVEVVSFPFVGDRDLDALGLPADDDRAHAVRLANPLSAEEPL